MKGFNYLACVAGAKQGRGRQSADGRRRVWWRSSFIWKKNELNTRVQKSIPYLWPKWLKNITHKSELFFITVDPPLLSVKLRMSRQPVTEVRKALKKSRNRMWSRNDVTQWVVQLSAELPLRCVWSLRAMVYVILFCSYQCFLLPRFQCSPFVQRTFFRHH